jgi:hypothetical protein
LNADPDPKHCNVQVLELTGLNCPTILQKGKAIIDGGFPTHQPLQHMQVQSVLRIRDVLSRIRIPKFFIPDPKSFHPAARG